MLTKIRSRYFNKMLSSRRKKKFSIYYRRKSIEKAKNSLKPRCRDKFM